MCGYIQSWAKAATHGQGGTESPRYVWTVLYIWVHGCLTAKHMNIETHKDTET